MKKLNNKGFTLVELLAVIVILAIVVTITMVAILPTLSSAKEKAFKTAVDTIQLFVQEEYNNCLLGDTTITGEERIKFATGCAIPTGTDLDTFKGKILANTGYTDDIQIESISIDKATKRINVTAKVHATSSSSSSIADGQFKDLGLSYSYEAK